MLPVHSQAEPRRVAKINLTSHLPADLIENAATQLEHGNLPGWVELYEIDGNHFESGAEYIDYRVHHAEEESRPVSMSFRVCSEDVPAPITELREQCSSGSIPDVRRGDPPLSFNCFVTEKGEVLKPKVVTSALKT